MVEPELCRQVGPNLPEAVRKADRYLCFAERTGFLHCVPTSNPQQDTFGEYALSPGVVRECMDGTITVPAAVSPLVG